MSGIPDLLEEIRKRPAMYLGECSLTALYHAIAGYEMALSMHGIKDDRSLRLPKKFDDWVAYRLHRTDSTSGWKRMILAETGDEISGFWRFFELLDQHATRTGKVVAKLVGSKMIYTTISEGEERTEHAPPSISLVKYTDDPGFFLETPDAPLFPLNQEFFRSLSWFKALVGGGDPMDFTIIDAESFEEWIRLDREQALLEAKENEAAKSEHWSISGPLPPPPPPALHAAE